MPCSFEDKLISVFVIWSEEGDNYLHSSKSTIDPMYYLRAFPCPLSLIILLYLSATLSFCFAMFSSLLISVSLLFSCSRHLLLTCFSSTMKLPCKQLVQACTLLHACSFFPRTSWIIKDLCWGTDSLTMCFVQAGWHGWLRATLTGPHTSSLHVASHHSSFQKLYLATSFDHRCLPS